MRILSFLAALVFIAGCQPEVRAIRYGEDACDHCKMTVSDERFAAELVTSTGKTYVFDAIECMAEFVRDNPDIAADAHGLYVTPFNTPGTLILIDEAFILHAETVRSPMGGNLAAFGEGMTPDSAMNALGGEVLAWEAVVERVSTASDSAHAPAMHQEAGPE